MHRAILFVLILVLCGCFVGCGGSASVENESESAAAAEPDEDEIYIRLAEIDAQQSGETDMDKLRDRFKLFVIGISDKISDNGPLDVANALVSTQEFYYKEFGVAIRLYDMAYSMYNDAAMRNEPTTWEDFGMTFHVKHMEQSVNSDGTISMRFVK